MDKVLNLLGRRFFVFLDEWLTYVLLIYLYRKKEYKLIMIILPFAIYTNLLGYISLWKTRKIYRLKYHI